jgi:uncharacterized protein
MRRQQAAPLPDRPARIARLRHSRHPMDPPVTELPTAEAVAAELQAARVAATPAELHGALCGWLAGGGAQDGPWLARLMVDDALPRPAAGSALDRLRSASAAQLEDRDFGFELLLPEPGASLAERSGALFDWCRGFLGGFGMAAGGERRLSAESREALADLARFAAAPPQEEGDQEDEDALAEIEEFVRVAALLLHGDCVLAARHRRGMH